MAIKAFPLNQTEYSYNAQDVMKYYAGRNSGVFETGDNLKVSANGGLEIRVNSGMGWLSRDYVASVAFWNESVDYLMVDAGHDTYDRVDLVVVSWNFVQQEQNPKLIIRKGTPASSPSIPLLVNDSSTIEIALARINVGKGSIELHDSDIVDLRGDDTYCPMVYDEQTIRETFRKCVGYADGVNKISDFPSSTPTSSDKILIEQGGEGKSATLESLPIPTSVQNKLDTKVNYTDSLTYEQIMASTDLTNKVASASALKTVFDTYKRKTVEISASNPTPLDLNNCTDLYTNYQWDYNGSKYVTCGGKAISSSAGAVIVFPQLGGCTQVFVLYQSGTIKVRCKSFGSWSSWYAISTSSSSL